MSDERRIIDPATDREILQADRARLRAIEDALRGRGAAHIHVIGKRKLLAADAPLRVTLRDKWTTEAWEIGVEEAEQIVAALEQHGVAKVSTAAVMAAARRAPSAKCQAKLPPLRNRAAGDFKETPLS